MPKAAAARQRLAATSGAEGFPRLQAAYAPDAPLDVRTALAVEVLRPVWLQQYDGPEDPPRWRPASDVPPAAPLIHAPYDVAARYSIQRGRAWGGDKAPATATGDADTPPRLTHVATTPATPPDDNLLGTIPAALAEQALLSRDQLVDGGATDAAPGVTSAQAEGVTIVGPVAADPSWPAREGTG